MNFVRELKFSSLLLCKNEGRCDIWITQYLGVNLLWLQMIYHKLDLIIKEKKTYTQMVNHSRNCVGDELFDYVNAPNYYNERVKAVSNYDKTDDFDICR